MKSQEQAILAWLKSGKGLTPLGALRLFGSFRLAARIWNLRTAGYDIRSTIRRTNTGKRVAVYWLFQP